MFYTRRMKGWIRMMTARIGRRETVRIADERKGWYQALKTHNGEREVIIQVTKGLDYTM